MSRLKELTEKNHENFKKIGLIDPDNSKVVNDNQSAAINAYMIIANISFTLAGLIIMIKYQDIFLTAIVVLGVCTANTAAKIIANAVQQHDMMINMAAKLRYEYELEKNKIMEAVTEDLDNIKSPKKSTYNEEKLKLFKEEIHKAAVERIEDNVNFYNNDMKKI